MDTEARFADKRLNDLVAVSVVILTVFLAVSKIKDDNIVQAMQKAQSGSVDAWAEYQAHARQASCRREQSCHAAVAGNHR